MTTSLYFIYNLLRCQLAWDNEIIYDDNKIIYDDALLYIKIDRYNNYYGMFINNGAIHSYIYEDGQEESMLRKLPICKHKL